MNELDTASAVADYLKSRDPAQTARANVSLAASLNPDQEAEFRRLSRESGVPVDSVRPFAPQVKAQVQANATDYSLLAQRFPSTTAFLGGLDNARVAHDDIENLSATEGALRQLKRYTGAYAGGVVGDLGGRLAGAGRLYDIAARSMVDALAAIGPEGTRGVLTRDIGLPSVSAMFGTAPGNTLKRFGKAMSPTDPSFGTDVAAGLGQLSSQIVTALVTPAPVSVGGLYAQGADAMGSKIDGDPASQSSKDLATVSGAIVTGVTEKYALDKVMGPLAVPIRNKMAAALARIGIAGASEGAQELSESILQDTIRQMVTNPDAPVDFKGAAYEGGVGATVGAVARALIESALHVKNRGARQEQRGLDATEQADVLKGLNDLAKASKVKGRDATTYESFIASALEDGPVPDLYIDPNALAQAGVSIDELAAVSKSAAEQLQQAEVGGTDIRIPTAEFAASIAGTDLAEKLIPHLKTDADGMSQAEADAYMREQGDAFKKQIEETLAQREGSDAFNAGRDSVALNIQQQLDLTQRFTPDVNKQYAALVASRYAALASRMGTSPEEVFRQYPLRIQAQGVMGDALNQGAVQTDTPEFRNWFGGSRVVDDAGLPQVVYHGTGADVSTFKPGVARAIWFAPDPAYAGKYVSALDGASNNIVPVYLSLQNPLVIDMRGGENLPKGMKGLLRYANTLEDAVGIARQQGHDGVIFKNRAKTVEGASSDEIAVFRPEQVKSAIGNRGTFDPTNPDIRMSRRTGQGGVPMQDAKAIVARIRNLLPKAPPIYLHDSVKKAPKELLSFIKRAGAENDVEAAFHEGEIHVFPANIASIERMQMVVGHHEIRHYGFRGMLGPDLGRLLMDIHDTNAAVRDEVAKREARGYGESRVIAVEEVLADMEPATVASLKGMDKVIAVIRDALRGLAGRLRDAKFFALADSIEPKTWTDADVIRFVAKAEDISRQGAAQFRAGGTVFSERATTGPMAVNPAMGARYAAAVAEKRDREALRILHEAAGLRDVDASMDRGGAHSPAGPDDGSPAYDVSKNGTYPEDVYGPDGLRFYGTGSDLDAQALAVIKRLEAHPNSSVTVYRAVEKDGAGKIVPGDWVTTVREYAKEHGEGALNGEYKILKMDVKARDIFTAGDSWLEWGYHPQEFKPEIPKGTARSVSLERRLESVAGMQDGGILNKDDNRGAYSPSTDTITILKGADLSTALHEFGHFFLELETRIASRPDAPQEMRDDANTLLKWFGIQPEPDADRLTVWNRMTLDEQRESHEKFARGFEAYLFEGRAPSVELRGIFQRFRSWLVSVYQTLKNLNVTLTDEVRGVMDRMVATQQEIETAEAARSMGMLFKTEAEAREFGVDWASYQDRGAAATQRAIDELGARGLKDMQWLDGAKSRILKQLQRDAAEKRREVRQEARREVLNRPVYRAWQFLTAKVTGSDVIAAPDVPKSGPGPLDPTVDSLFVAIAKLGGLNKDEVVSAWGIDPAERSAMPVFGKPVVRTNGGKSIDAMAEALYEAGYLLPDQDGRYDVRELEDKFEAEYRGETQYSMAVNPAIFDDGARPGEGFNLPALTAGRLDLLALRSMGLPEESVRLLIERKMTAKNGLDPDLVADLPGFGFESGSELVSELLAAVPPREAVEAETDRMMLERYGDITSPEAMDTAVNEAIHNRARARMVATELAALETALGESEEVKRGTKTAQRKTLPAAAKQFAAETVAALKIRDIRPSQFAASAARAARATEKALKAGDLETAAREKRNQLVNTYAAKAAEEARQEAEKARQYFRKFDAASVRKAVNPTFTDQIDALLERYEFRRVSEKDLDRRASLADWVKQQEDAGIEPDIPKRLLDGIDRKNYREMTVEELRGLVDTVKQIEHLGRLKNKLLTAKTDRAYAAIRDEIAASVLENSQGRTANTRTPTTNLGRFMQMVRQFGAAHIKAATWARVMDGGKDGGPVWEYLIRPANEAADFETTRRAQATQALTDIMAPVMAAGKMGGKGRFFEGVPTAADKAAGKTGSSFNREAIFTMALNTGNASNLQRLLGGEGWTIDQIKPVLETLSKTDWDAVQAVWDYFESMRPEIGAKERRVFGREPKWIDATPVVTKHGTYRGGYFPVVYDAAASIRAEENADAETAKAMLKGAHNAATTRRSFTKARVEEVTGRPLVLTLQGMYRGVNDVIHDLAWHEWLIDTNRLLKSTTIDSAIRSTYGPEAVRQFKTWRDAIAVGDSAASEAIDVGLGRLRQGVSMAGLSYNVVSALIQPLGITQSVTRIGAKWVGVGLKQYIGAPIKSTRMVNDLSEFMASRSRTRFRELNELRNRIEASDGGAMDAFKRHGWWMMLRMQQTVDVPTWLGAYEKAMADNADEARAIALADQAVKDAQGSGLTMDLSAIERGGQAVKLFTVFYSFMNTTMNLAAASKMSPTSRAKFMADLLLLTVIPAVLMTIVKEAMVPGDDGEDDEKFYKKMAGATLDNFLGLFVLGREFSAAAKLATGLENFGDYRGPAGLRVITDATTLAKQTGQVVQGGEFDTAFRKAAVNLLGSLFGLPAAQVNRSWTGAEAIIEGKTENPAAVVTGFKEPH